MASKNALLVAVMVVIVAMQMQSSSTLLVAGQPSVFTVTLDVQQIGNYINFIRDIRNRVAVPGQYTRDIPMLRQQVYPPNADQWFHVVLQSGPSTSITLRIRIDNIYFDGFRVGNTATWWEFMPGSDGVHLIPGSTFLPFQHQYGDMGSLNSVMVGASELRTAVTVLAAYDGSSARTTSTAQACLGIIVMICESTRFHAISNLVYDQIHSGTSIAVGPTNNDLIHDWGLISSQLIQSDVTANFRPLSSLRIDFPAQARNYVALVLVRTAARSNNRPLSSDATGVASPGRQLCEIYSLQVLNIDGENPGDLYGTVLITDDIKNTPQYIYNRKRTNIEKIGPNEFASLIGPTRAISALDSFVMEFNLMDYDSTSSDDEVSIGKIVWNYFDPSNVYDKPVAQVVKGQYGSVAINYAVFRNAVAAIVQITLINGDGENPANVFGSISVSNTLVTTSIDLFKKTSSGYVDVKPQNLIPLSRSVVVVPLGESLNVVANLWDYDTFSSNDAIAQGSAVFLAQSLGDVTKNIKGQFGVISVKISWSSNWN